MYVFILISFEVANLSANKIMFILNQASAKGIGWIWVVGTQCWAKCTLVNLNLTKYYF